jgi:Ala-tRNA(Pro) deacylase
LTATGNHNNRYLGITLTRTGHSPKDGARGMWIGNWTPDTCEYYPVVSGCEISYAGGTGLASHAVEYELHEHPLTFTARETAEIEGVDPRRFAKTVAVETDEGERLLLVVDAVDHLDLEKTAAAIGVARVRLLTEPEMVAFAPDCEAGTIPPVGDLFSVRVLADLGVREDPEITFHAGSHHFTVHVDRPGWERAGGVSYADLADSNDRGPAWAR